MAQKKTDTIDLKARLTGKSKSNQWIYWAVGALILVALVVPLALALPSFMPQRTPSYGTLPSAAEDKGATNGVGSLPPVSNDERESMISGAKDSGAVLTDDSKVSARFEKDINHATLSVPTGGGKTFKVKTYRLTKQGDGSWTMP